MHLAFVRLVPTLREELQTDVLSGGSGSSYYTIGAVIIAHPVLGVPDSDYGIFILPQNPILF